MSNDDRDAVAARLREARGRKFASAAEAARQLGMKEVTVRAHEAGQNGLSPLAARKYAKAYGVAVAWLLYGDHDVQSEEAAQRFLARPKRASPGIPIMGEIAAGVWREVESKDAFQTQDWLDMSIEGYESANVIAMRVLGTSMNQIYPEGRLVFAVPAAQAGIREGDHVVVHRHRSGLVEMTLKELVVNREENQVELWPRSTDPAHQVPFIISGGEPGDDDPVIMAVIVGDYGRRSRSNLPVFIPIGEYP